MTDPIQNAVDQEHFPACDEKKMPPFGPGGEVISIYALVGERQEYTAVVDPGAIITLWGIADHMDADLCAEEASC